MQTLLDDRFRIERPLAEGGMGVVYEGIQLSLDRPVAIKVIHHDLLDDVATTKRFLREVRVLAAFRHPNVVEILDYGVTPEGSPYLVMELVRGEALDAVLARVGRLGLPYALDIAEQICDVLAAAHDRGIVHRDLKPANVVVVEDLGIVKVLDFGLAKPFTSDGDIRSSAITYAGMIVGTPHYMAPEMILGETSDPRSDLYALGCMLFELLAGAPPFASASVATVLARQLDEPAPPLPGEYPDALRVLVHDLLAKSVADRPASAREVKARLASLREPDDDELPTLVRPSQPLPITPPAYIALIAVMCAIALVLCVLIAVS